MPSASWSPAPSRAVRRPTTIAVDWRATGAACPSGGVQQRWPYLAQRADVRMCLLPVARPECHQERDPRRRLREIRAAGVWPRLRSGCTQRLVDMTHEGQVIITKKTKSTMATRAFDSTTRRLGWRRSEHPVGKVEPIMIMTYGGGAAPRRNDAGVPPTIGTQECGRGRGCAEVSGQWKRTRKAQPQTPRLELTELDVHARTLALDSPAASPRHPYKSDLLHFQPGARSRSKPCI